jgi:hypothetical protein
MKPKIVIDDRSIEPNPFLGIGGDDTPLPDVALTAEQVERLLEELFAADAEEEDAEPA